MPLRWFNTLILAELETTFSAPAAGDAIPAYNWSYEPTVDQYRRSDLLGHLGKRPTISGARMAKMSFSVDLKGSGTAGTAPDYGDLLKACWMEPTIVASTSVTYNPTVAPTSPTDPQITISAYNDGIRYAISNAYGNVKFVGEYGKPWRADFEFTGAVQDPSDLSVLTATGLDTTIQPAILGATRSFMGVATDIIKSIMFDLGNEITMRPSIAATQGYAGAFLSDRRAAGEIVMEAPLVAAHDVWSKMKNNTTGAISVSNVGAAGNLIQITANAQAVLESVKYSEEEGRGMVTIPFACSTTGAEAETLKLVLT